MERAILKPVADILTIARMMITLLILLTARGSLGSDEDLQLLICLNLLGWTTDVLDGRLARASGKPGGRIGELDLLSDMGLEWGSAYTLARWGYLPESLFIDYAALSLIVLILLRFKRTVVLLLSAPVAGAPLVVSYIYNRTYFYLYLSWVVIALLVDWNRFINVVESFIDGLPPGIASSLKKGLRLK